VSKRNDISEQIRKYLNGELDAHAMHQLEKEAQNDPFLMDALEGYEQLGTDQQKNVDEVFSRLHNRVSKKNNGRVVMWRIISIAALILVALTIGGLWLHYNQPITNNTGLVYKANPIIKAQKPADTDKTVQPGSINNQVTLNNVNSPIKRHKYKKPLAATIASQGTVAEMKTDSEPLNEMVVMNYAKQRNTDKMETASTVIPYSAKKEIKGMVRDENGPLPGATINIRGTATSTQTDSHGNFNISVVPDKSVLDITCIGYNRKRVRIKKQDSLLIAMQPMGNALAEVTIIGYGTQKKTTVTGSVATIKQDTSQSPQSSLKKYLKDNAISPDGKTGTVKLSFTVNADNTLSNFKVIESVSPQTDNAAIALVKSYRGWAKDTSDKHGNVEVKVKFINKSN